MQTTTLSIRDSNMVGQSWTWPFTLQKAADGGLTLTAQRVFNEPDEEDEPLDLGPASGLQGGEELHASLMGMLEQAGIDLGPDEIKELAAKIGSLDRAAARAFLESEAGDEHDEIGPGGAAIRGGRLSKADELELYRRMDGVVARARG